MGAFSVFGDREQTLLSAKRCAAQLYDKLGISVHNEPPCGVYGCVWFQKRTGNAVKIVAGRGAQSELAATKALLSFANKGVYHPQLPHIFEIWNLGSCAARGADEEILREGAFAVVREDLPDVPWETDILAYAREGVASPLDEAIEALFIAAYDEWYADWLERTGKGTTALIEHHRFDVDVQHQRAELEMKDLSDNDSDFVRRMVPLFDWGFQHGMSFRDAHAQNWGIRPATGEIVLRDIGLLFDPTGAGLLPDDPTIVVRVLSEFHVFRGLYR